MRTDKRIQTNKIIVSFCEHQQVIDYVQNTSDIKMNKAGVPSLQESIA